MWIARIARPGAIYDESAAAQTCSDRGRVDVLEKCEEILENEEKEVAEGGKNGDFGHKAGCAEFTGGRQKDVNKVNLLKKNKQIGASKTHFTVQI